LTALDLGGLPRPRAAGGVTAALDLEGAAFFGGIVSEQRGKVMKVRGSRYSNFIDNPSDYLGMGAKEDRK